MYVKQQFFTTWVDFDDCFFIATLLVSYWRFNFFGVGFYKNKTRELFSCFDFNSCVYFFEVFFFLIIILLIISCRNIYFRIIKKIKLVFDKNSSPSKKRALHDVIERHRPRQRHRGGLFLNLLQTQLLSYPFNSKVIK